MVTCLAVFEATSSVSERVEEVGVGGFLGGGVLEQGFQALAALEEPQPLHLLLQALELARRSCRHRRRGRASS